jgi:hypothetical protein
MSVLAQDRWIATSGRDVKLGRGIAVLNSI